MTLVFWEAVGPDQDSLHCRSATLSTLFRTPFQMPSGWCPLGVRSDYEA